MILMVEREELSKKLFGFGISIGALSGIFASFITRADLAYLLSIGIPGGILTAALITIIITNTSFGKNFSDLILIGIVSGGIVGIFIGVLGAWTINGNYLTGLITGLGIGITAGTILILLTIQFNK